MNNEEPKISATRNTILSYISYAANKDDTSAIASGGSWGGYWCDVSLEPAVSEKPIDETQVRTAQGREVSFSEKDLYPLVKLWLEQKGYVTNDVASLKRGGKWGNPDIVGVNRVELFGAVEFELASCEVKLSDQNWEQFIFEAISHKRFCNRSWFCYRVDRDGAPMQKQMEYYAERYKVGILQVSLSDGELAKIKGGKADPIEFIEKMRERVPALYEHVPLSEKKELCERTGITISVGF